MRFGNNDRELLAIYLAIKHFKYFLEACQFYVLTDHKPLTYVMNRQGDQFTPRVSRHLSFISEFTTDIRHIHGKENTVADALSRVVSSILPSRGIIDYNIIAAAQSGDKDILNLRDGQSSLILEEFDIPGSNRKIWCDTSCGQPRPFIPGQHRQEIFNLLHGLAHPGVKGSQRLVCRRVVWPGMKSDIRDWTRACLQCQTTKVHAHTRAPLDTIPTPNQRFHTVHVDIVGPLPPSHGYRYILTCIDRFTRWTEAIPMSDITAETVAHHFLFGWVARLGVPHIIITDRGAQFESHVWHKLLQFLGAKRQRTTAYHPQSNGKVERFHRQLKQAIRAQAHPYRWAEILPLVMLSIRSTPKEDLHCAPAELVYGETLRLPGEFVPDEGGEGPESFLPALRQAMARLRPTEPRQQQPFKVNEPSDLTSAEYVLVRRDAVKNPLQRPYDGPFKVLARSAKHFTIDRNGRRDTVSVDRLKVARGVSQFLPGEEPPRLAEPAPMRANARQMSNPCITAPVRQSWIEIPQQVVQDPPTHPINPSSPSSVPPPNPMLHNPNSFSQNPTLNLPNSVSVPQSLASQPLPLPSLDSTLFQQSSRLLSPTASPTPGPSNPILYQSTKNSSDMPQVYPRDP